MISKEGQIELEKVTVFQSSAMFNIKGYFHCSVGENTLIIDNLTRKMEKNSVRIKGLGPGKIVNIIIEKIFSDEITQEKLKILTEERDELVKKIKEFEDNLNDLRNLKEKKELAQKRFAIEFPKWFSLGKLNIESIKNMDLLLRENIEELSKNIRDSEEELSKFQRKIEELNNKIAELGYNSQIEVNSYFKVSVVLDVAKEADFIIDLTFMVSDSYWIPFYDIIINESNVDLNLMANIYNQTEVDWNGITLDISTASAKPIKMEKPEPYNIDNYITISRGFEFGGKAPGNARTGAITDVDAQFNIASEGTTEELDKLLILEPKPELESIKSSVSSNFGVQVYNLKTKFNITSDKNPKPIHLFKETLPSVKQFFWTVSSPDRVLCNNKIRNKDHLILPGMAKVYVQDEFIGETALDLIAPNQEFKLGERITYDIKVKKVMKAKQKQKEGTFKGKNAMSYKYKIEIENLNDVEEELILYERIPHSISEKIKVKLGEFSEKFVSNTMNVLKFVLDMSLIKNKKVIQYDYEVISEKDVSIYPPLP